jgi:hypothetical protein
MLPVMDSGIPLIVRLRRMRQLQARRRRDLRVDMPFRKAKPMEACESGECPKCGAPDLMYLKRTQRRQ